MRLAPLPLLAACTAAVPVTPDVIPGTGYVDVTVDLGSAPIDPAEVTDVVVGDLRALDLRRDGDTLTVTVQGSQAGPATIVARTASGDVTLGTLTYEGPVDPLFDRFVAYGASLTQGTRDAVPTASSQLASPALQLARAAGAFHPMPLLADPLVPMTPDDVGDDCLPPDTVAFIVSGLGNVFSGLTDPATGEVDLARARRTPEVEPWNVAVGNATIGSQRLGLDTELVAQMLGRITLEPTGSDLFAPLERTPLERVVDLDPTLVVSFDLYGNDVILPLFEGGDVGDLPTVESFAAELDAQLAVLEATGAQVVLLSLPDVTLLPLLQGQWDDAGTQAVRDRVTAYADALHAAAATRPWLHVADGGAVLDTVAQGLSVGGVPLGVGNFQGILSLDGLHFTDTGYALAANAVITTLRDELGVDVPPIDLDAVFARDPRSPAGLRADGLPEACLVAP